MGPPGIHSFLHDLMQGETVSRGELQERVCKTLAPWSRGVLLRVLGGGGGGCREILQVLTLFQTKKANFPDPFSDQAFKICTRFQTWPLGRSNVINNVIITQIRSQTKKLFKSISNSQVSLFSHSFGIETINTFIHSPNISPSKTIPESRPKWAKCIAVFRPNSAQIPYPTGRHIQYMAYIREQPSPPRPCFFATSLKGSSILLHATSQQCTEQLLRVSFNCGCCI